MKWVRRGLWVVIGLPLMLVSLLLAAGLRAGAGKLQAQVTIAGSPEAVFAHLQDPALLQEWTGVESVRLLTEGAFGVGTRFRMTVSSRGGDKTELVAEVVTVEPNRQLTLSFRSVPGAALVLHQVLVFRLEETGPSTRLSVSGTTRFGGLWLRVLEPLVTPSIQSRAEVNLGRLKRIVESGGGK